MRPAPRLSLRLLCAATSASLLPSNAAPAGNVCPETESYYVRDHDDDGVLESCYVCDHDQHGVNESCYAVDTNGDGVYDACYRCDSDNDGVLDTYEFQCDTDGDGINDSCYTCNFDLNGYNDGCYEYDTNDDGIDDACGRMCICSVWHETSYGTCDCCGNADGLSDEVEFSEGYCAWSMVSDWDCEVATVTDTMGVYYVDDHCQEPQPYCALGAVHQAGFSYNACGSVLFSHACGEACYDSTAGSANCMGYASSLPSPCSE